MKQEPIIVEQIYDASIEKVWQAITDNEQMKQWYFKLKDFKTVPGFEFSFVAGNDEKKFNHLCQVKEVIPLKKLSYSWRYEGYEGDSLVSFELFEEGNKTRLKLTHEGLETFPPIADFVKSNFEMGWNAITGKSLKEYLERKE